MKDIETLIEEAKSIRVKLKTLLDKAEKDRLRSRYYEIDRQIGTLREEVYAPRTKGNVTPMMCPKCGKASTEYDEHKWKCLFCDTKFIYEPPQDAPRPDLYIKQEMSLSDEGMVYTCTACGTQFSIIGHPKRKCQKCAKEVCPDCWFGLRPLHIFKGGGKVLKINNRSYDDFCYNCAYKTFLDPKTYGTGCAILIVPLICGFLYWCVK